MQCIRIPDIPTLSENLRITTSGRNTFDVLNREGIWAAIQHYFDGKIWAFYLMIPFILWAGLTYFGLFLELVYLIFKRQFTMILFFLATSYYFMFVAGGVTMPRYQMPALIFISIFAAIGLKRLWDICVKRNSKNKF